MLKYEAINRRTIRWIVCVSFVPEVKQCSAYCCYHCDSLLITGSVKTTKASSQKSWDDPTDICTFTALASQLALWGQSISGKSGLNGRSTTGIHQRWSINLINLLGESTEMTLVKCTKIAPHHASNWDWVKTRHSLKLKHFSSSSK